MKKNKDEIFSNRDISSNQFYMGAEEFCRENNDTINHIPKENINNNNMLYDFCNNDYHKSQALRHHNMHELNNDKRLFLSEIGIDLFKHKKYFIDTNTRNNFSQQFSYFYYIS